jgi:hypothetical protein
VLHPAKGQAFLAQGFPWRLKSASIRPAGGETAG